MNRARPTLVAVAVAVLVASAGVASAQALQKVSVGILFMASDSGVFVAKEKGYFAEQGIEIGLNRFTSGADIVALMATDKLDVGSGSATPGLYNAYRQGLDIQIVASKVAIEGLDSEIGGGAFLVRQDLLDSGEVKTLADLKGRKIAVNNLQSTSLNYVLRGIAIGGLAREDVTLLELPFGQFIPAFQKKAVDAELAFSPLNDTIKRLRLATDFPAASVAKTSAGDTANMMFYSPGFAKTDTAKRFMVAHIKGLRDYYRSVNEGDADHDAICAMIHKNVETVPADCSGTSMSRADPDGKVNVASLERFQKEWLAWGVMREPADIRAHVNMSFAEAAVARLGPYRR
jgi:NitT/TauT family transport system substrate-binding protein